MSLNCTDKVDISVVAEPEVPESEVCESDNLENGELVFGDGDPNWLSSLLASITDRDRWIHESLLSCLVVLMYEMGFYLDEGPVNSAFSFDVRVMRQLRSKHFIPSRSKTTVDDGAYRLTFKTSLSDRYLNLALVPVGSIGVVDLIVSDVGSKSFAFDCVQFFNKIDGKIIVENRRTLSTSFRTKIFELLTDFISDPTAHPASILRLPVELLIKISSFLTVSDFVKFTMCSKKLYSLSEDEMIWKNLAKLYLPARSLQGTYKQFCKYQYKLAYPSLPYYGPFAAYPNYFYEFY